MAAASVLYGSVWRWLLAVVMAAAAGLAIAVHTKASLQDKRVTAVVGADSSELTALLYETRNGLAIRLQPGQRAELHRQLADAPLSGDLLAIAALDAEHRGSSTQAQMLGDLALRIEPRTKSALLARITRQMKQGRNVEATQTTLRLLAVNPNGYRAYIPILAQLAHDPRTLAPIAASLAAPQLWRTPFLALLNDQKRDPAIRYALMNPALRSDGDSQSGDRMLFVQGLVYQGDYERAYLAWVSFLPDDALPTGGLVYDPGFDGRAAPAPFNWRMMATDGDRAEIANGVLNVSYSGRRTATLLEQILLPMAGRYRIVSSVQGHDQGNAPDGGTALTWRLACLPGNAVLAELPLPVAGGAVAQQSQPFDLDGDRCAALSLTLVGSASEFPSRLAMRITGVRLSPAIGSVADAPRSQASPMSTPSLIPPVLP